MKYIFLILIISMQIFAQEEQGECAKEVEAKCDPNLSQYECIMADSTNKGKKFSKKCWPEIINKMKTGKIKDPCMVEMQTACPNDTDGSCIRANRNSFSTDCQEKTAEDGSPKMPSEEQMKKTTAACEEDLKNSCGMFAAIAELAYEEGDMKKAKQNEDDHSRCTKMFFKHTEDQNCKAAYDELQDDLKSGP